MSFIAGYLLGLEDGGGGVIKSITITENGTYNAANYGCNGFNPALVNVPDRYDEGYQKGYTDGEKDGEAAVKDKIQSKTITENGTYSAADDGLDGFDPVIVNVSDPRIDDITKYIEDFPGDVADTIGTITGTYPGCSEVGENHSYYYTAMYTKFSEDTKFGGANDAYIVDIKIYQDGKLFQTITTRIPARSSQDAQYSAGMDNFAKNFYWEKSDDGNSIRLNYHYFSLGSWSSYNLFRNTAWYNL